MTATARFPVVYLLGVAHCGSTLLGRLMNRHSQVLCVGEMRRTDLALQEAQLCGCGTPLSSCDFWRPYLPWLEAEGGNDHQRFTNELFSRIGAAVGKPTVLDLSKTRNWRMARWRRRRGDEGYVILIRDSRGVMSSTLRQGKDVAVPLKKHRKWMKRYERFAKVYGDRAHLMYYEDLCREPEIELRKFCSFLGIDFEAQMLRPADAVHHFIHSSASGYLKGTNDIRLDERWRRDLLPEVIERIEATMTKVPLLREHYLATAEQT